VQGSPFHLAVVPAALSPANCTAHGAGVAGGALRAAIALLVVPRDGWGNALASTADIPLSAVVRYPAPDPTTVVPDVESAATWEFPAVWRLRYIARNPGAPAAHVTINRAHISGSPFALRLVDAVSGPADAARSRVDGLAARAATAGAPAALRIQAVDGRGLWRTSGGDVFEAQLVGASPPAFVRVEAADNGDGSYSATYTLTAAGEYALVVRAGAARAAVHGSPFSVTVAPAGVSVAHSVLAGDGLSLATAGTPASFSLEARDRFGNRVRDPGSYAGLFAVQFSGPASGPVAVARYGARFAASYNLTVSGAYSLLVAPTDGGAALALPLVVRPAALSARRSDADAAALAAPLTAGAPRAVAVRGRDVNGNPADVHGAGRRPESSLRAELEPFGEVAVLPAGGAHTLTLAVTAAGRYQLRVRALEAGVLYEVSGSPYAVVVAPDAPDAAQAEPPPPPPPRPPSY